MTATSPYKLALVVRNEFHVLALNLQLYIALQRV